MLITKNEAEAISDGVKKFLLVPAEEVHEKEIRRLSEGRYAAVVECEEGTLDYWLHDKKLLQDHGFAHPHEFTDYLRKKFGDINDDADVWMRVELVRVPEWDEVSVGEVKQGLFKLLFRMKTENRL